MRLFQRLFPNAIGSSIKEFLLGSPCSLCQGGSPRSRWSRYDGTGSWRMHRYYADPDFSDFDSTFCQRNGWFSRHWFATVLLVAVALILVGVGNAARAAGRPDIPDAWFCIKARAAVLAAGSEKAAEDAARAQGASEATIAKAKRCKR